VITAGDLRVMAEVPRVERLVLEALSAKEPSGRPGTGQLGIPVARSAAGTTELTGFYGVQRSKNPGLNSLVFTECSGVKIQCSDLLCATFDHYLLFINSIILNWRSNINVPRQHGSLV